MSVTRIAVFISLSEFVNILSIIVADVSVILVGFKIDGPYTINHGQ